MKKLTRLLLSVILLAGCSHASIPDTSTSTARATETVLRQRARKEEKFRNDALTMQAAVNEKTVHLTAKVGENGHLFGSITAEQIAEALKEQHNYDIDRKKIVVDGAKLKEVGTFPATINLYKEIKAQINVEVVAE